MFDLIIPRKQNVLRTLRIRYPWLELWVSFWHLTTEKHALWLNCCYTGVVTGISMLFPALICIGAALINSIQLYWGIFIELKSCTFISAMLFYEFRRQIYLVSPPFWIYWTLRMRILCVLEAIQIVLLNSIPL